MGSLLEDSRGSHPRQHPDFCPLEPASRFLAFRTLTEIRLFPFIPHQVCKSVLLQQQEPNAVGLERVEREGLRGVSSMAEGCGV